MKVIKIVNFYDIINKKSSGGENMKTFIKWAGGKEKELPIIMDNLPEHFDRYVEPFVGGGAVLFSLKHNIVKELFFSKHFNTSMLLIRLLLKFNSYNKLLFKLLIISEDIILINYF